MGFLERHIELSTNNLRNYKGRRKFIQEDIGGHPPIPLGPPPLFLSVFPVFLIVAPLTIFGSFRVLNFRRRFEALNDVFLALNGRANMSPFRTQYLPFMDVVLK